MKASEQLKEIRKNLNISQRELGKRLKLSRGYISELELGIKEPSGKVRRKINNFYKKNLVLVEVMTPEKPQPKLSWFDRLIKWIME